jgi:hypothetical protein
MESFNISLNGYRLDTEFKNVPISFVNGLRRILLAEIPTVVIRDVQILDNSTKMIHEMLKHRVEMLPINVRPEEAAVIRDTRIELRYLPPATPDLTRKSAVEITTDDFAVQGPRKDVFLKDRDLGAPLFFMNLQPSESIHVKATLGVETTGVSQVCVSTFKNHIDPELAKLDKDTFVDDILGECTIDLHQMHIDGGLNRTEPAPFQVQIFQHCNKKKRNVVAVSISRDYVVCTSRIFTSSPVGARAIEANIS